MVHDIARKLQLAGRVTSVGELKMAVDIRKSLDALNEARDARYKLVRL